MTGKKRHLIGRCGLVSDLDFSSLSSLLSNWLSRWSRVGFVPIDWSVVASCKGCYSGWVRGSKGDGLGKELWSSFAKPSRPSWNCELVFFDIERSCSRLVSFARERRLMKPVYSASQRGDSIFEYKT